MHARISTIEGDASKIDDAVAVINDTVIPTLKAAQGFTAANFMADRSTGKLVGVAFWEDQASIDASADTLAPVRSAVADAMGGKIVSVETYEMVAQSW